MVNPAIAGAQRERTVALAKAKPNSLNFAHNGPGTLTRLTLSLLQQRTGIEVGNISYRGDNFSIADVISGQVQGMFSNSPVALPRLTSGQVRGLAVTWPSDRRRHPICRRWRKPACRLPGRGLARLERPAGLPRRSSIG